MFDFRGKRILVADDDEASAKDLVHALEAAGAQVIGPAAGVDEARAYLESGDFDGAVIAVDLDGTLMAREARQLTSRRIPTVVAMDDATAYPQFWPMFPRCEKPVEVNELGSALDRAAETHARKPNVGHVILVRHEGTSGVSADKSVAEAVMGHLDTAHLEAKGKVGLRPASKIAPADIPIIELDATRWRNIIDFNEALKQALGSPEGHGESPDAWVDSMLYGGMNDVEPPYRIRIAGTFHCRAGLLAEINLLADVIRESRAWKLEHYGEDVEVGFEIVP